jgi:isopropylmalate/homocitrate/citramalate synthase
MFQSIINDIFSSPKHFEIYKSINPVLFDVSLRDGIQNADPDDYDTKYKMEIFDYLISSYNPTNIEIGALVSSRYLHIMNDSVIIHKYAVDYLSINNENFKNSKIYMLVPTLSKLQIALDNGVTNFSMITSVSDEFQKKNTNRTILEMKDELRAMTTFLDNHSQANTFTKKLYISCINYCPISRRISSEFIINELCDYNDNFSFDELCISDTTGELTFDKYKFILDSCIIRGIIPSKLSLHLHVSSNNYDNVYHIIFYSLSKNINKFDVSMLDTGGCSVSINDRSMLKSNLSYDLFYYILWQYIDSLLV